MLNPLGSLFERVIKVKIRGTIDQKMTDQIMKGFKKVSFFKPQGLIVSINSHGGTISQAQAISDILKNYSIRHNIPIYCFAQDQCLNSANVILTTGSKCYTNSMTLMGDIGYSWNSLWLKKFGQKYNIKQVYITAGENKVKFDPFSDLKPENQKWMQNYLYLIEHELKVTIINNRRQKLQKLNLQNKDIDELFNKGIISPEIAIKNGLIDGVLNSDEIIHEKFPRSKIYQINSSQQKFRHKILKLIL